MKIGINIRVMGHQSSPDIISNILTQADQAGIESAWIVDHIAIPPDDSEGSGGRYLDPLTTLAWMAALTRQIKIGTSVLVLPYRPPLPTAKSLATIQELSGGRLLLGVGIGWMAPEFRALGVPRQKRGQIADDTLSFLHDCFDHDVVEANGQPFLFNPRPAKPPMYIGGGAPHAIDRALRSGTGWMPMGRLEKIAPQIRAFRQRAEATGHPGEVVTFISLSDEAAEAEQQLRDYENAGVTRVIVSRPYDDAEAWLPTIELIHQLQESLWN
ncbi:MAG: TIGR03619 family F420-dependent LLM class oxidoreductase [Gammaproteobacteria bacterium]